MNKQGELLLRVCYFGTYRANYNRNQIMIAGLRQAGVEVVECHANLWRGIEDRARAAGGGWLSPVFWGRMIMAYLQLLHRYRKVGDYDVMVVGYPGILDVFLARLLTTLRHRPLVWDVLLSIYQVACERGWQQTKPITVKLLHWLETTALRMPDLGLLDTPQYAEWFRQQYPHLRTPLEHVLIGADERFFVPPAPMAAPASAEELAEAAHSGQECRVLYYGAYLPNHGIRTILEAARLLLEHTHIHFEMIGQGIEHGLARELAAQWELTNVTFVDWLEKKELAQRIQQADIILGAFGNTLHSLATIHNKTYEGLAMGKVVLTGDAPVMRQYFHHGQDVYLCPQADAQSLAQAILDLSAEPGLRRMIGENGQRLWREHYTLRHAGEAFREILLRLVNSHMPMKSR